MNASTVEFPPPYWILVSVESKNAPTEQGQLTPVECELKYNENYYNIERFDNEELWIARLLELGITEEL